MDLLCLRERDLLKHFTEEVSHYLAQGESREKALMLVKFTFYCTSSCWSKLSLGLMWMQFIQSYQVAEDLARAFTERTILQIFLEDEVNAPAGSLKVNSLSDDSWNLPKSSPSLLCQTIFFSFVAESNLHVTLNLAFAGCIGLIEVYVCHGLHRRICIFSEIWLFVAGQCCRCEERSLDTVQWTEAPCARYCQFFWNSWCLPQPTCFRLDRGKCAVFWERMTNWPYTLRHHCEAVQWKWNY